MDCRNEAQRFPLSVIAINNPESARRLRLFVLASRDAEASNKNEVVLKSQLRDDSRYPSTFRFSDACTSQQYSHFNTSDTYTSG
ncbi:hypothetical protein OE749_15570 [Aestuariibacter sp. AA17]|uniref:Uncharacterized protein n=1 Tax=Fluctibacter corallii TaxID=2984329 RepID=A0ABT3ACV9_9ALTE|nr:hypothetical protein [Aestuariibacter sp. AA17]MCV2886111.1 hypothetical protein [Aestuariibacter sp. AA17]